MIKKIILSLTFVGLGAVFYLLFLTSTSTVGPEKQEYVYVPEKRETFADTPQSSEPLIQNKSKVVLQKAGAVKKEEKQHMTEDELISKLHASLDVVDPRTPKLISEEDQKILEPTKEQRADPKEFAKYEAVLNEQSRRSFAVSDRLIQSTRENIQKAEEEGTRTQEEIDEAKEALAKMEEAQQIMAEENIVIEDKAI